MTTCTAMHVITVPIGLWALAIIIHEMNGVRLRLNTPHSTVYIIRIHIVHA